MNTPEDHIQAAITALTGLLTTTDPEATAKTATAVLATVPALQSALRQVRQTAVLDMRAAGASHADVGTALGITRGRAAQIAKGPGE